MNYQAYRAAVVNTIIARTGWPPDEAASAVGNVIAEYNEGEPHDDVAEEIIAAIEAGDDVAF